MESYKLLSDLNTKKTIDLSGFKFIYKKMDTDKDMTLN